MVRQLLLFLLCFPMRMTMAGTVHPFDLLQFRPVLSQCRLQCPSTSPSTISDGRFDGVTIANHFYTANDDDDAIVLSMQDPVGNRCELRHNPEWSTSSTYSAPQTFRATLCFEPNSNNAAAVTLMQIHSKNFLSYVKGPPLMLGWQAEKNGQHNHLWAKIRMNLATDSKSTTYFALGPLPRNTDFVLQVTVDSGILRIWIDGDLKLTHDWRYLDLPQNYFKTGERENNVSMLWLLLVMFSQRLHSFSIRRLYPWIQGWTRIHCIQGSLHGCWWNASSPRTVTTHVATTHGISNGISYPITHRIVVRSSHYSFGIDRR